MRFPPLPAAIAWHVNDLRRRIESLRFVALPPLAYDPTTRALYIADDLGGATGGLRWARTTVAIPGRITADVPGTGAGIFRDFDGSKFVDGAAVSLLNNWADPVAYDAIVVVARIQGRWFVLEEECPAS